jgi:hypothetical protein
VDLKGLREQIAGISDDLLADELVAAYQQLKTRYLRRDFRPGQLEAGRFAEAAFRILQLIAGGKYTPLDHSLPKLPALLQSLESSDASAVHDSVRLHIPKALAAVYNVRNRRDIGHIAGDVDSNSMDATYVVATCDWVLAELVRVFHKCSPEEAQAYIESIVRRRAPLVQEFGDVPFVLRRGLPAKDEILVLLWGRGTLGASLQELDEWAVSLSRKVISARLGELERSHRFIRRIDGRAFITDTGIEYVESRLLAEPAPSNG